MDLPDSLSNAVTFPGLCPVKVLSPLAERLPAQAFQGIRSHARRAAAPSRSPAADHKRSLCYPLTAERITHR